MHEISLVQGIIEAVRDTAEKRGGKAVALEVRVGELAQFDIRLVRQLLKEFSAGTAVEGARITVKREKSRLKCLSCGAECSFEEAVAPLSDDEREVVHFFPELISSYTRCPACSKSYLEILAGRSVRIAKVTLDA